MSGSFDSHPADPNLPNNSNPSPAGADSSHPPEESAPMGVPSGKQPGWDDEFWQEATTPRTESQKTDAQRNSPQNKSALVAPVKIQTPPLVLVETAFLASTASLLWLVSYYLNVGPWMRILFPVPIALAYLRWGLRASWMSAIVSGLLLSVLMGPYLSLLFFIPSGLLGVQLGAMWKRGFRWFPSILTGTFIATFGFFFRIWILSIFLGEDVWNYLTNRIADFIQWILGGLVNWGLLGLDVLGQTNLTVIQLMTVGLVLCSDFVYLFTIHLVAWLLLERIGNPIPAPPQWVQVLMEEET